MNYATKSLFLILFCFVINACGGPSVPSSDQADKFCEKVMLRMSLCRQVYQTFTNLIPEKHDIASNIGVNSAYDVMIKTFDEELETLEKIKIWESTEEHNAYAQQIKDAAKQVLNVYHEGGQNEILEAKKMINAGATVHSSSVVDLLVGFESKLNAAYGKFGEEQEKFAEKYGIILY